MCARSPKTTSSFEPVFYIPQPRIAILTAYESSFEEVAQLTVPRMERYAKRHQYAVHVNPHAYCERPRGWIKIPEIRRMLEGPFDFVLWLDADALILREDVDVLSAIIPGADLQMSWLGPETTDWQAPGLMGHFNAGVMLIRVSEWARQFFAEVWKVGDLGVGWGDQATILHLLGYDNLIGLGTENSMCPYRRHVALLNPIWNSVPGVAMTGDPVIHHYAGLMPAHRLQFITGDLGFERTDNVSTAARRAWNTELNIRVKQARDSYSQ